MITRKDLHDAAVEPARDLVIPDLDPDNVILAAAPLVQREESHAPPEVAGPR